MTNPSITNVLQNASESNRTSSKFSAFGGTHDPCPVCGRTKDNDCRYSVSDPDYILCHTFCDTKKGHWENGYICVSEANGHTAGFKPGRQEQWDKEAREKYNAEKESATLEKAERAKRDRESRIARELPVERRDAEYKRLLSGLELSAYHEQKLLDRGFTLQQISDFGFKSIKSDMWVGDDYPTNLAGIHDGKIATKGDGLAFPIKDVDGKIIALWYHPDEIKNGGKYKPLSSPNNSVHVQAEIPLAYYPGKILVTKIFLVEGHGFKDKLANAKHGITVLSASGGQFSSSPELLKAYLAKIANPGDTIVLTPDGGDVQSKQNAGKWIKTAKLIRELGYEVIIAWWSQYKKKENPDIDELDDLSKIEYITVEQFQEIHKDEYERYLAERKTADNLKKFFTMSAFWRKSREFTATYEVEMKDFAFPSWIKFKQVIVSVRSGLGSNKTGAVLALIKRLGMGAIIVGYRNNLLTQTCERGQEFELGFYHISEEGAHQMICDDFSNLALCLDSIKYVDGHFGGKILVLDETCSVLLHALSAGTLGKEQAKAIAMLTKAIRDAECVILLDGNLADIHTDFISKLCPEKQLIKIENTRKIAPHDITFVVGFDIEKEEVRKNDQTGLIRKMTDESCVPFIATDSKKYAIIIDKILKDSGKRGYALHGDSVAEDWAKEFLKDPNAFIEKHKPDYIIISPTAESGVSVTINGHFTHKFSFFFGVLGTNSQHQMMFRLRDDSIPHYVSCPEVSGVADRSVPQTYIAENLKKILEERILQSAKNAGERASDFYAKALARQHDDWWELSCELTTLDTFEMNNLKWCLIQALEEAGHNVSEIVLLKDEEMDSRAKKARKFVNQKEAKELFVSDVFPDTETANKASKKNPNIQTRRKIEKTFLLDRLTEIEESEVWNEEFIWKCVVENKNFIKQQERYWLLNNYEFSEKHHEVDWSYESTADFFFNGRVAKMQHDKIKGLKEIDIIRLEGMEYHKDSPIILEILQKLRDSRELRIAFNIQLWSETTDGKKRLEIIGKLLNIVGLKNQSVGQKTLPDGRRARHYKCVPVGTPPPPKKKKDEEEIEDKYDFLAARKAILEAIDKKQRNWIDSEKALPVWDRKLEKELQEQWTEAAKNELEAIWLKEDAVSDIADTLKLIEDFEQYKLAIIDSGVPEFATKAALSTLTEQELNRLCEFGVERVPLGSFKSWNF